MIYHMDYSDEMNWLLLVITLPTSSATGRMRLWRAFKSLGCAALRDGAYLLPSGAGRREALRALGDECAREGGSAWLMTVTPDSSDDQSAYRQLFDRSEQYAELRTSWRNENRGIRALSMSELTRLKRRSQKELDALRATDFFPSESSAETEAAWVDFSKRIDALLSPGEPHETAGRVPRLDRAKYRGRTWATRKRLWVDRVSSAWLIRRFIDPEAKFRWLAKPSDCPKRVLGFDFDGATFTHVGDLVTFETLIASFDLGGDAALVRLGAMVHALDVGGEPVPEAKGFEAVMAGARERIEDDDKLLIEMSAVLDSLYAHFLREASGVARKAAS